MSAPGILAWGAYVPPLRLSREQIATATGWMDPNRVKHEKGARALCAWDEDSITMAVAAARDCAGDSIDGVDTLCLASTSLPFADRSNAVLVAEALGIGAAVRAADCTGSQRAGTTALAAAAERARGTSLVIASERRVARTGSEQEMSIGHAAAALVVGAGEKPLATCIAQRTVSADFVDHYRASGEPFDHTTEGRWLRDEGLMKIVPGLIGTVLDDAGLEAGGVDHAILPGGGRVAARLCRAAGIEAQADADLLRDCGECGVADPLLRFCAALEQARPGQHLLVVGFGQGADALLFETTDAIDGYRPALGVGGHRERRRDEDNYVRYLAHQGLVDVDWGNRAEFDNRAALPTFYRKREAITGFTGGQCTLCDTIQFPPGKACVNPDCRAFGEQKPVSLARVTGKVKTFTEDWLAFTPDPPLRYGNIEFDVGGNLLMEIVEAETDDLRVGLPVEMCFRVKEVDRRRNLPRYFWKARPVTQAN